MTEMSQSSAYGALPYPALTPERKALIRSGRVFSLQHTMHEQMPQWAAQPSYHLTNVLSHDASRSMMKDPVTGSFERIEHSGHSGTHIDALCHVGCVHGGVARLHGGSESAALWSEKGFAQLGAEHFPPILLRGVLFDLPALKGVERLPDLYEVTPADIAACEQRQGRPIEPGTAVLLRTGFESLWASDPEHYMLRSPGPRRATAEYIANRGAVLTGSDTANYEVVDFPDLPAHVFLIYERGIPIVENLRLDELAAAGCDEFLFVALPIAFAGATGASIHPIAIA